MLISLRWPIDDTVRRGFWIGCTSARSDAEEGHNESVMDGKGPFPIPPAANLGNL